MKKKFSMKWMVLLVLAFPFIFGCMPKVAPPTALTCPPPIEGTSGTYMCPYTSDEVLAEWVDKSINAQAVGSVGGAVGAYAGAKAMENIPFVGGFLGEKVGNAVAKKIAIEAAGGMEFITNSSDLSFNSVYDMSLFLYVKYSNNDHYQSALKALQGVYPEFKNGYQQALVRASRNVN